MQKNWGLPHQNATSSSSSLDTYSEDKAGASIEATGPLANSDLDPFIQGSKKKRKPRAPKHREDAQTLNQFKRVKELSGAPKKEDLRIKIIRGHKRAIKTLTAPKKPLAERSVLDKAIARFRKKSPRKLLTAIASAIGHKSFNDDFCKNYFETPGVLRSYIAYVDLEFIQTPEELRCFFRFSCCGDLEHSVECREKWESLKYYLTVTIPQQLGVTPVD